MTFENWMAALGVLTVAALTGTAFWYTLVYFVEYFLGSHEGWGAHEPTPRSRWKRMSFRRYAIGGRGGLMIAETYRYDGAWTTSFVEAPQYYRKFITRADAQKAVEKEIEKRRIT